MVVPKHIRLEIREIYKRAGFIALECCLVKYPFIKTTVLHGLIQPISLVAKTQIDSIYSNVDLLEYYGNLDLDRNPKMDLG